MSKEITLFHDFWKDFPSSISSGHGLLSPFRHGFEAIMNGKCDFEEREDGYDIALEVPGVKKDEISINLQDDTLRIHWSRTREKKEGILKRKTLERSEGSFVRSFLVEGADPDQITADLDAGVLRVHLPKKEGSKPKNITIN
jgi:HSP20 family protein